MLEIAHSVFLTGLAVLAFASTNVDALLVLLAFLSDPSYRAWEVVAGQFVGVAALVAVSLVLAQISRIVPAGYVGLFGLVPIAIGVAKLRNGRRGDEAEPLGNIQETSGQSHRRMLIVAAVVVSNGGDNVGTYVPFFAGLARPELTVILVVFATMTAAWCGIAQYVARHRRLGAPLRIWGRSLLPWVLIAIGCVVLVKAAALETAYG